MLWCLTTTAFGPMCGTCGTEATKPEVAKVAMAVENKNDDAEADPLDQNKNSSSEITLKGAKWDYKNVKESFEHSNTFSALADSDKYPDIKDAILTLHKNRHQFPKIKRVTQYSPEIEKLAKFIEQKMKVKNNKDVMPKETSKPQIQKIELTTSWTRTSHCPLKLRSTLNPAK